MAHTEKSKLISKHYADIDAETIAEMLQGLKTMVAEPQAERCAEFIKLYYRDTSTKDLQASNPEDLLGAALAHWQFGQQRGDDEILLRVYNPDPEQHSWQSPHTIVEVVTQDRPFLIESLKLALQRAGHTIHLTVHPVIRSQRDADGQLVAVGDVASDSEDNEAWMHLQIDKNTDAAVLKDLETQLRSVLVDVNAATGDWALMRDKAIEGGESLKKRKSRKPELLAESAEFMQWLADDHFTFLGYCQVNCSAKRRVVDADSCLGVLALPEAQNADILPAGAESLNADDFPLLISKSSRRSTVHRDVKMDLIALSVTDKKGTLTGWQCFVGLFTSTTYRKVSADIPLLRRNTGEAKSISGLDARSHDGKTFADIIETFPFDLMMQSQPEALRQLATGILDLQERQRVALFGQAELFGRFYNCLVYVPREKYGRDLRLAVQEILTRELGGYEVEFDTDFSSTSALARISYVIWTSHDANTQNVDWDAIEAKLVEVAHSWEDHLHSDVIEYFGEERGNVLFSRYAEGFDAAYRQHYRPIASVFDIERMESIASSGDLAMRFYRPPLTDLAFVQFKLYSPSESIELSAILPIIENMGLHIVGEQPFKIRRSDGQLFFLHEFTLRAKQDIEIDPERVADQFTHTVQKVWQGQMENDSLNQLVIRAELGWRDILVLRALVKYMQQIGSPFSGQYVATCLCNNTEIASALVALFNQRFDPQNQPSEDAVAKTQSQIDALLDKVTSLDEDRILRIIRNLIEATLRSNHFQRDQDGAHKPYLSLKLDPKRIEGMPLPLPKFEIWVYAPEIEGIHLRGGNVARGGLRWSDRREDFRTEILGLAKAQMVKNSVIVPVGSKGGFVVKNPLLNASREALQQQGIDCYKTFLMGLLDITDNRVNNQIVPPRDVVRYDQDDPYLVVAADKGTATFSDHANAVSADYGFWLGDAFASGGSKGYDHKAMGITARGAWESVKRHFREFGVDTQREDFTVVGVGDMAGDVFGNGMLLSPHIKLVAAFNHMHIFVDPDPDPSIGFKERERLFAKARSSWADYDSSLLSKGGGVFERSAKSIKLSAQARKALDIQDEALAPNDLINAIIKAPVDLFWNGGIGTYIKAIDESNADVADRANDAVRVNGNELRCKVIGEGGNLGVTQKGRIEFARRHQPPQCIALNYTDAIDNCGGVDCSDHEVNIKILLDQLVVQGELTHKQRDQTLEAMTEEVADLVLRNNELQTECISTVAYEAPQLLSEHSQFMSDLESQGLLNRSIEFLPDNEAIAERRALDQGLTRPEISVLVSYAKMTLFSELLETDVPDDPYLQQTLIEYFPSLLRERYAAQIAEHQLRREIIATVLGNDFVNRLGPSFAMRIHKELGADTGSILRAYAMSVALFDLRPRWAEIEALDGVVSAQTQTELLLLFRGLVERSIHWLVRSHRAQGSISDSIEFYQADIGELIASLPAPLAKVNLQSHQWRSNLFIEAGVPEALASQAADVIALSSAFDITEVAKATSIDVVDVARIYFEVGAKLELQWLRDGIAELNADNHWHNLAKARLRSELHNQQRRLCAEVITSTSSAKKARFNPDTAVDRWCTQMSDQLQKFQQLIDELKATESADFAMLSVAVNEVGSLIKAN